MKLWLQFQLVQSDELGELCWFTLAGDRTVWRSNSYRQKPDSFSKLETDWWGRWTIHRSYRNWLLWKNFLPDKVVKIILNFMVQIKVTLLAVFNLFFSIVEVVLTAQVRRNLWSNPMFSRGIQGIQFGMRSQCSQCECLLPDQPS